MLPEAVLCTREVNEAARKAAYDLIVSMCEANIAWKGDSDLSDSLLDFLSLVVAGLAGSPHMVHCTILSLTWLICQYKEVNMNCFIYLYSRDWITSTPILK